MNAQRTFRFAALLSAFTALVLTSLLSPLAAAPVDAAGGVGQALALRLSLSGTRPQAGETLAMASAAGSALNQAAPVAVEGRRSVLQVGPDDPASQMVRKPRAASVGPPVLVPYTTTEVVHVALAGDPASTPRRNGDIAPGQTVTLTVRLTPGQSPVDSNNVYIQIKDPDSRYQDTNLSGQPREHKVFATNHANGDAGSAAAYLYNGGFGDNQFVFTLNNVNYGPYVQPGLIGGPDPGQAGQADGHIAVGRSSFNGTNPIQAPIPNSNPQAYAPLAGGNPANFTVLPGQEYECQYLKANYTGYGTAGADPTDSDYGTPYYLAGVDDRSNGSAPTPRAEWLKLSLAPTQDAQGGTLYTAQWQTPKSPSDFYLDVIAYDTSRNWRIYDNVWGFSTQPFDNSHDILVVSDNALGQKFAASAAAQSGISNIRPVFYGAESYLTDIDTNILPNAIYRYLTVSAPEDAQGNKLAAPNDQLPVPQVLPISRSFLAPGVLNGLGVGSYSGDGIVDRETVSVAGNAVPRSQAYSLWRILSRGAVTSATLSAYLPGTQAQPAVLDPVTGVKSDPANVPVATRCVVWTSPYTGDLPLNAAGSLADPATQDTLRAYVGSGGRLFVTGQDVGSTITIDGTTGNSKGGFLPDVLSASLTSSSGGSQTLAGSNATGSRITYDSLLDAAPDILYAFNSANSFFNQFTSSTTQPYQFHAPGADPFYLGNSYENNSNAGTRLLWRTDGSLDQIGPALVAIPSFSQTRVLGQIDTISAQNGAHTDITNGLVYNELAGGGRTVYASFGLEGLGTEFYKVTVNGNDSYWARNQRQNILHNIVSYLRTGTFTGFVYQGSGGGNPLPGATVYLQPNSGTIPGTRQIYSGTTDQNGQFTISGVEPGAYSVVAYKTGFTRAASGVLAGGQYLGSTVMSQYVVEGDTTTSVNLNILPTPPGSISGTVTDDTTPTANPVANAAVSFTSSDGTVTVTGTSDANGAFTITNVPAGSYTQNTAAATGYSFVSVTPAAVTVQSGQAATGVAVVLHLMPPTISGTVTDQSTGRPIGKATVTFTPASGTPSTVTAAADGTYTFTTRAPFPATYSVTASASGYYTNTPPNGNPLSVTANLGTNQTGKNIALVPIPTGSLGGLVTNIFPAGQNTPLTGVTVTATDANGNVFTTTTAANASPAAPNGDGQPLNYEFTGTKALPANGAYTLTFTATNFVTVTLTNVTVTGGGFVRRDQALTSTLGALGGLLTDSFTGKPVPGATVTLHLTAPAAGSAAQADVTLTTAQAPSAAPTTPAGGSGQVNFASAYGPPTTGLQAGTYTVSVTAPNYQPNSVAGFVVTHDAFTQANIQIVSNLGNVGGLITDNFSHQPLVGATVTLTDASGNVIKSGTTGAATVPPAAQPGVVPTGNNPYPVNYTFTGVPQGTYTVTVSAPGYTTGSGPGVVIKPNAFTQADLALQSTQGTLGGLVTDGFTGSPLAGATITVTNSQKTTVAVFTTTGTAVASPAASTGQGDSNAVNYAGRLVQGTGYTVTVTGPNNGYTPLVVTPVTITANKFTRVDFTRGGTAGSGPLQPLHVFPAGLNFFSTPFEYASLNLDTIFGASGTGGNRSRAYVWQPLQFTYVADPAIPADGLHLGQGYWIKLAAAVPLSVRGALPTGSTVSVPLHPSWNMIGVPSQTALALNSVLFADPNNAGKTITFAQASSPAYNLVSGTLYGYDPATGQYVPVTAGATLQPYAAYWIKAYTDTTIVLPTAAS